MSTNNVNSKTYGAFSSWITGGIKDLEKWFYKPVKHNNLLVKINQITKQANPNLLFSLDSFIILFQSFIPHYAFKIIPHSLRKFLSFFLPNSPFSSAASALAVLPE